MAEKEQRRTLPFKKSYCITLAIFSAALALVCGFVFLSRYEGAYDSYTGGAFISPEDSLRICHYFIAFLAVLGAFFIKAIFGKRVSVCLLLIVALLLPIGLYHYHYHTLKKDGPLYFLVDEGGIFHFIVIGDYNFDGMNDELYRRRYEEREYSCRYSSTDNLIDYVESRAVGTGYLESCFCFYDWEEQIVQLFLQRDDVTFKEIQIVVMFEDAALAQGVSFYLDGQRLSHTVSGGAAILVFDEAASLALQERLITEERYIPIEYRIDKT